MQLGGLVTLLVLLPNLLMIFLPPTNLPPPAGKKSALTAVMEIASLAGMILALIFYYLNWGRYLRQGRAFRLLFHSWYLLAAAVVLGTGHIYVSRLEWQRASAPLETVR